MTGGQFITESCLKLLQVISFMVLRMQTRQPCWVCFMCVFAHLTVKSYESSTLLFCVKTSTSVAVFFCLGEKENIMIPIWVCMAKHGSDSKTHRAVLPKHTHYYSTETLANLSRWITVIS